ncbi:MAG: tetratricopeptide repeat protein, partial [Chloroflexota bacterium]
YLLFQDDVWIRHWGYLPEPELMERKKKRNHRLLEMALEEDPTNPFMHYNVGKQYVAAHQFREGLPSLERAIELWRGRGGVSQAYVGNMFALAMNAAAEQGDNARAVQIEALVPQDVVSPDILFQAGVAWMRLGRREEALKRLHRAVEDTSIRQHIEGDPSSSTWRPLAALAQLHLESGEAAKAYQFALQAHEYAPELPNLLYALMLSGGTLKRYEESIGYARKLLSLDVNDGYKRQARRLMLNIGRGTGDQRLVLEAFSGPLEGIGESEVVLIRAEAHAQMGEIQDQYDVLAAGCRDFPSEVSIRLALADVLDAQDCMAEAASVLGAGLDQPNPPAALYARL